MYYDRPGASVGESCRGIAGLRREAGRYMKWVVIIILLATAAAAGYRYWPQIWTPMDDPPAVEAAGSPQPLPPQPRRTAAAPEPPTEPQYGFSAEFEAMSGEGQTQAQWAEKRGLYNFYRQSPNNRFAGTDSKTLFRPNENDVFQGATPETLFRPNENDVFQGTTPETLFRKSRRGIRQGLHAPRPRRLPPPPPKQKKRPVSRFPMPPQPEEEQQELIPE